jgi:hypothetical protein
MGIFPLVDDDREYAYITKLRKKRNPAHIEFCFQNELGSKVLLLIGPCLRRQGY